MIPKYDDQTSFKWLAFMEKKLTTEQKAVLSLV